MLSDLRHAARLLLKDPGFTSIAVLVLALGIGANTAVFTFVNALLLRPIPSDAPQIFGIYSRNTTQPNEYRSFSYETYDQIRADRSAFADVMAFTMTMAGEARGDTTRQTFAAVVTANYFSTLDVPLAAGRPFSRDEERPGSNVPVAIVGHAYARREGVSPADIIGRTVRINARDYSIVGVAPEGFSGTMAIAGPEFWLPLGVYDGVTDQLFNARRQPLADPAHRPLMLVGRLREGLDARSAGPALDALSLQLQRADPAGNRDHALHIQKLSRVGIGTSPQKDTGPAMLSALLMGMSALVLLLSCLNLANMLLARGNARRKEIAVRLALGGGRLRVIRQLLVESLLLALLGGAAGLLLAFWGTTLAAASMTDTLPLDLAFDGRPDIRVLTATAFFCVLSTVVAGLAPAWKVTRPDVLPDLKQQSVDYGGGRRFGMRNLLVVGQVALSLALLTAAGLFMRGALKAGIADPGFPLDGGLIVNISPAMGGYDEVRGSAAIRSVLQRVRSMPGVRSASLGSLVPFGDIRDARDVRSAGAAAPDGSAGTVGATFTVVGADYFETLRIAVLRGRGFTPAEEEATTGPRAAIIDAPLARRLFAAADPIGREIEFVSRERHANERFQIVGVVAGVRDDMFQATPEPHVYVPFGGAYRGNMNLHIRADGAAAVAGILASVRKEIQASDPSLPIVSIKTLEQHRDSSVLLWAVNSGARLFSTFGAAALLLALIGVYGVKSYVVSRRTREIGVRMALGATPADVLWLVLRDAIVLTVAGVAVGLVLSWGIGKAVSSLLYQVSATDPVVFTSATLVLTASALVAAYIPARRATLIVPLSALRTD